jgi:hypothetical protein
VPSSFHAGRHGPAGTGTRIAKEFLARNTHVLNGLPKLFDVASVIPSSSAMDNRWYHTSRVVQSGAGAPFASELISSTPHLQRAIGDPQSHGSALKVTVFGINCYPNSGSSSRLTDLLESGAQRDGLGDTPLEALVGPYTGRLTRRRAVLFGKVTGGDRPGAGVSNCDPLNELTEFTDVARVGSV